MLQLHNGWLILCIAMPSATPFTVGKISALSGNRTRDRYVNKILLNPLILRPLQYTNKQPNLCLNAIYFVQFVFVKRVLRKA